MFRNVWWECAILKKMCRYLALVTALAAEADFVFIPEWPPHQDWASKMCKKLLQARLTSVLQHKNMMHELY